MPPAASAETCHSWPNRGRACQRAPPSEADEEDAAGPLKDRLIAELTEHRTKVINVDWWIDRAEAGTRFCFEDTKAKVSFALACDNFGVPCQDG